MNPEGGLLHLYGKQEHKSLRSTATVYQIMSRARVLSFILVFFFYIKILYCSYYKLNKIVYETVLLSAFCNLLLVVS